MRPIKFTRPYVLAIALLFVSSPALACDLCAIYQSLEIDSPAPGDFRFGLAESFTEYDRTQQGGRYIENTAHQRMNSSITQLLLSYGLTNELGLQLSLPYINRRFARLNGHNLERGTEAGIGDMALLVQYIPFTYNSGQFIVRTSLQAGIEFPTGDTDRLKEELDEDHHHEEEEPEHHEHMLVTKHGDESGSAVHGHDLALGSGSFDFPIGANVLIQYCRFSLNAGIQYALRTEGDHDYQYANDLLWSVAPGYDLFLEHEFTLAIRANLSGEFKPKDEGPDDERQDDTGINAIYLGPQLILTMGDELNFDLGLDLPVNIENSGLQTVASYRLRAAMVYHF